MPFAFPSHQGFIAPLWRKWPGRFDVPALCIGAAIPDAVDGIAGAIRGGLGQWYGHTLVGLFLFCVPAGMLLTWLARRLGIFMRDRSCWPTAAGWLRGANTWDMGRPLLQVLWRLAESVWLGAFSHLFFDFISHGNFLWFYPWYENPHFFPSWWYLEWFKIPLPGYKNPYPAGPHLAVWVFLSVMGAVMLFWPFHRKARRRSPGCSE